MALTPEQSNTLGLLLQRLEYLPLVMQGAANDLHYLLNAPVLTKEPEEGDDSALPPMGEIIVLLSVAEKRAIRVMTWEDLALTAYTDEEASVDIIDSWLLDNPAAGDKVSDVASAIVRSGDTDLADRLISIMVAGGLTANTAAALRAAIASRAATMYEYGPSVAAQAGLPAVTAADVGAVLTAMAG